MGDDAEMDAEGRLRVGRTLGSWGYLGLDGQVRARLAGPKVLPNGRSWDFAAGPQIVVYSGRWFASSTTGPTTMGLTSERVGFSALLSVGGVSF